MKKIYIISLSIFLLLISIIFLIYSNEIVGTKSNTSNKEDRVINNLDDKRKIIGTWERLDPLNSNITFGTVFLYDADGFVYPLFNSELYWKYWFEDGYLYEHTYSSITNEPVGEVDQRFEYNFITDDLMELKGGYIGGNKGTLIFVRIT